MRRNRGFSLVELIIVIAIMAVLTAVLVPSYLKYVAKSREAACRSNVDTLEQECLMEIVYQGGVSGAEEARQIMSGVLAAQGKTAAADGSYAGICPGKGSVTIGCDESGYYPYLVCSVHGAANERSAATTFLQALTNYYNDKTANERWNSYWSGKPSGKNQSRLKSGASLDSAGANFGGKISDFLKDKGVDVSKATWSVYRYNPKGTGTDQIFNVYFTETDISGLSAGKKVTVTKFDILTGTSSQVTLAVAKGAGGASNTRVLDVAADARPNK